MQPVTITLPFPPSVNSLFANRQRGPSLRRGARVGRVATPRYRSWQSEADMTVMAARIRPISGSVNVEVTLHPPNGVRRDCDNHLKPILDCLVRMHVLPADDWRVVKRTAATWGDRQFPPVAVVTITPAE